MLDWFQRLMPREDKFFELFKQHAAVIVAGADALRKLLETGDQTGEYCKQVFARENEADEITRQVLVAVRRTFITPFDRSDIQALINSMDDSIDQMNKTAKTITLFEVKSFEPHMREMADVIMRAAELTIEAMPLLSHLRQNASRLNAIAEEITKVEEESDQIYDRGIKALFLASREAKDPMGYIVGAEIYDHLEKVVDRFEDVANHVSGIVIENL